jgi:hypothetical protein
MMMEALYNRLSKNDIVSHQYLYRLCVHEYIKNNIKAIKMG